MSLLADLLSKIKQPETTREVPPNLKKIVRSSSSKSAARRKVVLISGLVCVLVLTGLVIVYFINTVSETSDLGMVHGQRAATDHQSRGVAGSPSRNIEKKETGHAGLQNKNDAPATTVPDPEINRKRNPVRRLKPKVMIADPAADTPAGKTSDTIPRMTKQEPRVVDAASRDALLYRAREFEMRQEYTSTLSAYKEALEMDSGNVMVLNNIAYIYLLLGLELESLQYAHRAEELDADYTPALINLGIAYAKTGNAGAAEYYLDRAFRLEPDNRQAIYNLALLKEKNGNYAHAADFFSKLVKLGDSSGTLGLARTYEMQGNNREALKAYKNAALMGTFDKKTERQIRQRIMTLQDEGNGTDSVMPIGPLKEATQ